MLDPNFVRENLEAVQAGMNNRGLSVTAELQQLATAETHRKRLIPQIEGLKREQNTSGDQVARAKRNGEDAKPLFEASKARAQKIKQLEVELDAAERQRTILLEAFPNLPHASVPVGKTAADNVVVRTSGEPRAFDFEPKAHWDLGSELGVIDFERATKISGTRFAFLMGAGAQLERALINFMLSLHTNDHGYTEVQPPFLVSSTTLYGTGQLPKFE
jgi:seryl-tRNA synthetase